MDVQFPEVAEVLFDPAPRYICLWGGRGSGKSWSVARALLIRAANEPLRILCGREFQNSVAESVHKLLSLQIEELGLGGFYEIQNTTIIGKNGSEFIFTGLKNNAAKLKSYESINIAWIEEAQAITKGSWEILTPTIRLPGSQIICTFNPVLETDFIYQFFLKSPPPNAVVVRMNYTENPWFGEPLLTEMKQMQETDPDSYLNTWLGNCRQTLDGAIYAKEIRAATAENRITNVPYDASKPVDTFFDLGRADKTAIWFAQIVGFEFRLIDYYESSGHGLSHYMKVLQERPYVYGDHWLPHDAQNELLASERTIEQQMRAIGHKVRITPKTSIKDGIEAARSIFNRCWFDENKTADGLQCLRHYQYDVDPETKERSMKPLHNWASHGSDAFRYLAVGLREKKPIVKLTFKPRLSAGGSGAWMG